MILYNSKAIQMLPFPYKKEIHVFRCFFCKDQAYFSYTDLYEENNYKKDQTWIVPVLVIIHENKTQVEKMGVRTQNQIRKLTIVLVPLLFDNLDSKKGVLNCKCTLEVSKINLKHLLVIRRKNLSFSLSIILCEIRWVSIYTF